MTKRTVFTAAEVKHLTESPAALLALVDHHDFQETQATEMEFVDSADFHRKRALVLKCEAHRLANLYDNGDAPDYEEASQLVTGLHLADLIDFCTDQASLYNTNIASDRFDTGYVMACERFVKKLKELEGTYVEHRDPNGNLLFTYSSIHKGEFTKDPIPFELEVEADGHKVKFVRAEEDDGVWPRYFSQIKGSAKQRITKEQYIALERSCGFHPKSGNPGDLATGGFGHGDVYGHVEYVPPKAKL